MSVPLRIALRYLFTRKSNNVIGWISAVSTVGMAIGAAALILVLSVYNGFDGIIRSNLSDSDPDWLIVPQSGKTFMVPDGFDNAVQLVQDKVFMEYDGKQSVVNIKGRSNATQVSVSADIAQELGIRVHRLQKLHLYFPKRDGKVSVANPMASINSLDIFPQSIYTPATEFDAATVIASADEVRSLLGMAPGEVSALELWDCPQPESLPEGLKALNRVQQHPELYKMMRYEKAAIYLILLFVVILISFNILASLSMLQIEKEQDRFTMSALGMRASEIRKVFLLEGWLVSLLGMIIGLALGMLLAWLQQRYGLVAMPGNSIVSAYPVVLKFTDVLLTAFGVALVGFITSAISTNKI